MECRRNSARRKIGKVGIDLEVPAGSEKMIDNNDIYYYYHRQGTKPEAQSKVRYK